MSDDIVNFLFMNSIDGEATNAKDITALDILLSREVPETKTVGNSFTVPIDVNQNDFVQWSFSTKYKDIGFSVEFCTTTNISNGLSPVVLVPYQRYRSHKDEVTGSMESPGEGQCYLIWDNSYSMMRSKELSYTVQSVDKGEMECAKELALEAMKSQNIFMSQKENLRKVLAKQSKDILSHALYASSGTRMISTDGVSFVTEGDSGTPSQKGRIQDLINMYDTMHTVNNEFDTPTNLRGSTIYENVEGVNMPSVDSDEEAVVPSGGLESNESEIDTLTLEAQIVLLKEERNNLGHKLSTAETALVEERDALAAMTVVMEEAIMARDHSKEQQAALLVELNSMKMESDSVGIVRSRSNNELASNADSVDASEKAKQELVDVRDANAALEQQVTRLRGEKKQLKLYAIQMKADLEASNQSLLDAEDELSQKKEELFQLKDKFENFKVLGSISGAEVDDENPHPIVAPENDSVPESNSVPAIGNAVVSENGDIPESDNIPENTDAKLVNPTSSPAASPNETSTMKAVTAGGGLVEQSIRRPSLHKGIQNKSHCANFWF